MLAAFALSIVGSVLLLFLTGFQKKHDKTRYTLYHLLGPRAILFVLIPVVIAAVPLVFLHHPRRRIAWNAGTFVFGLCVLTYPVSIVYLFAVVIMVWGIMKASRADGPRPSLFASRRRSEASSS